MSNDQTFIEQPQPQPEYDDSSIPPLPPPPPPPGSSSGGNRKWLLLGVLGGLVVLIVCLVGGYLVWQLVQGGTLPFGADATSTPDGVLLTQTALVDELQDIVLASETPEPTATELPTEPVQTETPAPTDIPAETQTPTSSVPLFTANQAIFCRLGPSSVYQEVRTMNAGDVQPVLGQSVSPVDGFSIWWLVEIEGRQCFVSSDLGSLEGDPAGLPVIPAPPTPTPTPTATPTPTSTPTPTP